MRGSSLRFLRMQVVQGRCKHQHPPQTVEIFFGEGVEDVPNIG